MMNNEEAQKYEEIEDAYYVHFDINRLFNVEHKRARVYYIHTFFVYDLQSMVNILKQDKEKYGICNIYERHWSGVAEELKKSGEFDPEFGKVTECSISFMKEGVSSIMLQQDYDNRDWYLCGNSVESSL